MTDTIYVITGTSGSYSDRQDWNVCAVECKEQAERIVELLQTVAKTNRDIGDDLYRHEQHWLIDNPAPHHAHTKGAKLHGEAIQEWYIALHAMRKSFREEHPLTKNISAEAIQLMEELGVKPDDQAGNSYDYEELRVIDVRM